MSKARIIHLTKPTPKPKPNITTFMILAFIVCFVMIVCNKPATAQNGNGSVSGVRLKDTPISALSSTAVLYGTTLYKKMGGIYPDTIPAKRYQYIMRAFPLDPKTYFDSGDSINNIITNFFGKRLYKDESDLYSQILLRNIGRIYGAFTLDSVEIREPKK